MTDNLKVDKPEIVRYSNPNEFFDDIKGYVFNSFYGHYLLIKSVDRIISKVEIINDAATIKSDDLIEIIFMHTSGGYYIYGEYSSPKAIELLADLLEIDIIKEFGIMGNCFIVEKLQEYLHIKLNTIRHRYYLKCNSFRRPKDLAGGELFIATDNEEEEISKMGLDFYINEFGEGRKLSDQEAINDIVRSISAGKVYYWRADSSITAYLAIIDDRNGQTMIGSIYTKPEHRKKGYGTALVYQISETLRHDSFGLMVDADNTASINMFTAIGFEKIYETGIYQL